MKYLVEFKVEDGRVVTMEADAPQAPGGIQRAANTGQIVVQAKQTLESALEGIKPAADAILNKLSNLTQKPDEVQVTFGLKVSGDAHFVIASGGVEANYNVTLKWTKERGSAKRT